MYNAIPRAELQNYFWQCLVSGVAWRGGGYRFWPPRPLNFNVQARNNIAPLPPPPPRFEIERDFLQRFIMGLKYTRGAKTRAKCVQALTSQIGRNAASQCAYS